MQTYFLEAVMILNSAIDRAGLVLTPEINPKLMVQFGPYEDQIEMKFPGERPVGGPEIPPVKPTLNERANEFPAQGLGP